MDEESIINFIGIWSAISQYGSIKYYHKIDLDMIVVSCLYILYMCVNSIKDRRKK
jgi:hypothetical protein